MPGAGVDTSEWECPCDVADLVEWVVKEAWECDVCGEEFPDGTIFFGNRDEEWDVCEFCYNGKAPEEPPKEEAVTEAEMQARMAQLSVLDSERKAKNKTTTEACPANALVHSQADAPSGEHESGTRFSFTPGMRVQAYLRVLGRRSEEPSFGSVSKMNADGTIDIAFDMGKTQVGIDPLWVSPISAEFERQAYERRIQQEQRKMIEEARKVQAKKFEAKKVSGVYGRDDAVEYLHPESKMGWQPGFITHVNDDGTYDVQGKKSNGRTDWFKHWATEKIRHFDGPVARTVCRTSHSAKERYMKKYSNKI